MWEELISYTWQFWIANAIVNGIVFDALVLVNERTRNSESNFRLKHVMSECYFR